MSLSINKVKKYRQLQQKKYRDKEQLFVIEGRKMVLEAIKHHPQLIKEIICTDAQLGLFSNLWNEKTTAVTYDIIKQLSSLTTPQEIIAILHKPVYSEIKPDSISDLVIVLEDISDPGNLGTIIRMADWFGIKHIICSKNSVDCFNPKVIQATMGGALRVNITYTNISEFITFAKHMNTPVYGTTLQGENVYEYKLQNPAILVMGNESNGLSSDIELLIDNNLFIPNYLTTDYKSESLNLSTAAAIVISEFRRQQYYSK